MRVFRAVPRREPPLPSGGELSKVQVGGARQGTVSVRSADEGFANEKSASTRAALRSFANERLFDERSAQRNIRPARLALSSRFASTWCSTAPLVLSLISISWLTPVRGSQCERQRGRKPNGRGGRPPLPLANVSALRMYYKIETDLVQSGNGHARVFLGIHP